MVTNKITTNLLKAMKNGDIVEDGIFTVLKVPGGWLYCNNIIKQQTFVSIPGINNKEVK